MAAVPSLAAQSIGLDDGTLAQQVRESEVDNTKIPPWRRVNDEGSTRMGERCSAPISSGTPSDVSLNRWFTLCRD